MRIIRPLDLAGVPTLLVVELGRDVEVFEELERSAHRNTVLHGVFSVFNQIRLEEQILFGRDAVAESSRIAHGDLLIPTLLADGMFPLEREGTAHRDGHAGERDSDRRVAGGLIDTHVRRDGERVIRKALRNVDRRALRVLVDCRIAS